MHPIVQMMNYGKKKKKKGVEQQRDRAKEGIVQMKPVYKMNSA